MQLQDKTIVFIGGGRAMTLMFAAKGAKLAIVGMSEDAANEFVAAEPKRCTSMTARVCASARVRPACLIRKLKMARLIASKSGESKWGWAASRERRGIGNDSTH